jgi:hypothetical protein
MKLDFYRRGAECAEGRRGNQDVSPPLAAAFLSCFPPRLCGEISRCPAEFAL